MTVILVAVRFAKRDSCPQNRPLWPSSQKM